MSGIQLSDGTENRDIECRVGNTAVTGGVQVITVNSDCGTLAGGIASNYHELECNAPTTGQFVTLQQKTMAAVKWILTEVQVYAWQ